MIEIKNVKKIYPLGDSEVVALNGVNAKINEGEIIAIIGTSGSGKSTLLNALGGMDTVTSGEIIVDGVNIVGQKEKYLSKYRLEKVGFVFQFFHLIPILTVRENLVLPLLIAKKEVDEEYLKKLVDLLGLKEKMHVFPNQLSGGQKQRVAVGRALIHKPRILLADEPTGNLDSVTTQEILSLMLQCAKELNQTMVIVTHDKEVANHCERIIKIEDGNILEEVC